MTTWGEIETAVEASKPTDNFPELTEVARQHLAFIRWMQSQDLDVPTAGTSLTALLGLMVGASCKGNLAVMITMMDKVQDSMIVHALVELRRRMKDGAKGNG